MKIAIYGGTFNPPHLGHEKTALLAWEKLHPDMLFVIPTYIPPHKQIEAGSPSPEQRLILCKKAFEKYDFVSVSDIELKRKGSSYTFDTLSEFIETYPDSHFYLIIGSDSLIHFTEWRRFEDLFKMCSLVVFSREKNDFPVLQKVADEYKEKFGADIILIHEEPTVISSSEIRKGNISANTVSTSVFEYIIANHLYGYGERNSHEK